MIQNNSSKVMSDKIKVCIIGAGNCAFSLFQALHYYKNKTDTKLLHQEIGGFKVSDIEIVCCFDVDERKVGLPLKQALIQRPNCTPIFTDCTTAGPKVLMGNVLDGISPIMNKYSSDEAFRVSNKQPSDVVDVLRKTNTHILINYLPVGSHKATEFYANCCLKAHVSFLNCIPVRIASNKIWEKKFIDAGLPLMGDDIKSQFGASIVSQMLQELANKRGVKVKAHIQRNVGGNTDFLNMTDSSRLKSKKESKEGVIKAHLLPTKDKEEAYIYAGPSEYIKYYGDQKIAHIHLELEGFLGAPISFESRLAVYDSPNSAGVVIDAIRYLKVAQEIGIVGTLRGPSAFTQKSPPIQMSLEDSISECEALSNRQLTDITKLNKVFTNSEKVIYTDKTGEQLKGVIHEVHFDISPPYYTIKLEKSEREIQTTIDRLNLL